LTWSVQRVFASEVHISRNLGVILERRLFIPMLTVLVVILLLAVLGALPTWPYSRSWGYYPSGGLGILLIVVIILLLIR
jgi:hypothetical protein